MHWTNTSLRREQEESKWKEKFALKKKGKWEGKAKQPKKWQLGKGIKMRLSWDVTWWRKGEYSKHLIIKRQRDMKHCGLENQKILAKIMQGNLFTSLSQRRAWSWWSWGGRKCGFCAGTGSTAQTSWCSQWRWWKASEQHLKEQQRGEMKSQQELQHKSTPTRKFLAQKSIFGS